MYFDVHDLKDNLLQMYEIHQAVANIEVEGKRFQDICFRIPISDIFHSRRRRRRRRQATALEDASNSNSIILGSSPTTTVATTTVLSTSSSSSDSSSTTVATTTVSSSDSSSTTTTTTAGSSSADDGWSEDLWADYDYDSEKKEEADRAAARIRIDYAKYGPRLEGQKRVDTSQVSGSPH
jgi:hypothetical protein